MGAQGVSTDILMHVALGTSMASIMFTSISSFMAHHKRGAVRWEVVRRIVIGIFTIVKYNFPAERSPRQGSNGGKDGLGLSSRNRSSPWNQIRNFPLNQTRTLHHGSHIRNCAPPMPEGSGRFR